LLEIHNHSSNPVLLPEEEISIKALLKKDRLGKLSWQSEREIVLAAYIDKNPKIDWSNISMRQMDLWNDLGIDCSNSYSENYCKNTLFPFQEYNYKNDGRASSLVRKFFDKAKMSLDISFDPGRKPNQTKK